MPDLIPFYKNGKRGYSDSMGNVIVQPKWDIVNWFRGEKAMVVFVEQKEKSQLRWTHCLIDKEGNYIIPPSMNWTGSWCGWSQTSLNASNGNGKYGLIDTNNNLILPFIYDYESYYSLLLDSFRVLSIDEKKGLLNTHREVILPFKFEKIQALNRKSYFIIAAQEKDKWYFYNLQGKKITSEGYDYFENYPKGNQNGVVIGNYRYVNGSKKLLFGWLNIETGIVIRPMYQQFNFYSSTHYIADGKMYEYATRKAVSRKYHQIYSFKEDSIIAIKKYKYDYYDLQVEHTINGKTGQILAKKQRIITTISLPRTNLQFPRCGSYCSYRRITSSAPLIYIDSSWTSVLMKDSIRWNTKFRVLPRLISVQGQHIRTKNQYVAFLNDSGRVVTPKILIHNSDDALVAYNKTQGLAVLRLNIGSYQPHYKVIDAMGNTVVSSQHIPIGFAFYNNDKELRLVIDSQNDSLERSDNNSRGEYDLYWQNLKLRRAQIADENLLPLPHLKSFNFVGFADADHNIATMTYAGWLILEDSLKRIAYSDDKGDFLMPELAFKYTYLRPLGNQMFVAKKSPKDDLILVNRYNESILPTGFILNYMPINQLEGGELTELCKPFQQSMIKAPLYKIDIREIGKKYNKTMYLSFEGRVFADLDLNKD